MILVGYIDESKVSRSVIVGGQWERDNSYVFSFNRKGLELWIAAVVMADNWSI